MLMVFVAMGGLRVRVCTQNTTGSPVINAPGCEPSPPRAPRLERRVEHPARHDVLRTAAGALRLYGLVPPEELLGLVRVERDQDLRDPPRVAAAEEADAALADQLHVLLLGKAEDDVRIDALEHLGIRIGQDG